jgi:hypothetical protein
VKIARSLTILIILAGFAAAAAPARADHRGGHGGRTGHVRSVPYHHYGGSVVIRPSLGFYWGPGWGSWGWYDPWWYGPRWGYTVAYPNQVYGDYGALDCDVSPERAEVWVDGKKLGVADDYDGFPTYLWLQKGTYDVVFYLPGYKTIARQYTIYPGLVIDVEDKMETGEATHPLDIGPKSHERRDARLQADRERLERWQRQQAEQRLGGPEEQPRARDERRGSGVDARVEPGRITIQVQPEDASVYLDGRFLGTGRELSGLRAGLIVDPGSHKIQVVRPGSQPADRTVEVASGKEVAVEIDLDSN